MSTKKYQRELKKLQLKLRKLGSLSCKELQRMDELMEVIYR